MIDIILFFFSQFKYFTTIVIIVLEFSVKASSDAHILLAPCDGCDGYEVVIGGRSNGLSIVSIHIHIYICLRSRPGSPNVVCPLVSKLVS